MGWESQLNRNEMARQSAALSKVAQGLDNLSETVRSNDDLRRQLADAKAENERLRASAYTPIVILQNGAVVSMSEQGRNSIVVKADEGWVLMALPHEETYIEIQVERE